MTDMKLPDSAAMIQAHKEYRARCKESNAFVTIEQAREDDFYSGYMAAVEYFNSTIEAEIKRLREALRRIGNHQQPVMNGTYSRETYQYLLGLWKQAVIAQAALAEKGE